MNAPLHTERLLASRPTASEPTLPLATAGVLRVVWESRFGPMLIEVRDGCAFVNGERVEPAESSQSRPHTANETARGPR